MKYIVEKSSITAIADAIRVEKNTDSPMTLADMATAIHTLDTANLAKIIVVATTTVTFDSDFSGTSPVDGEFVDAIYNDYRGLNGYPQAYMYSVVAEELQDGFFASSEQFFINSAAAGTINISFASVYHKWWTLTNGVASMKEANASGFVVGASAGKDTTIKPSTGIWAATGAAVKAGTYRVSVFRLGAQ